MGLPHLRQWLRLKMPKALTMLSSSVRTNPGAQNPSTPPDHVFIDTNGIIHSQSRTCSTTEKALIKFLRLLNMIVRHPYTSANRLLFLAADGSAPVAKLILQRARRLAKSVERERKGTKHMFDSRQITPGCMFMDMVEQQLAAFACAQLVLGAKQRPGLTVTIDAASSPGEGELKIVRAIHNMQMPDSPYKNDSFVIVGSDADIILQAIVSNINCKIYAYDYSSMFDSNVFRADLSNLVTNRDVYRVSLDLAAMVLMTGNDYFPKVRYTSLLSMWNSYLKMCRNEGFQHLVNVDPLTFNMDTMRELMLMASRQEEDQPNSGMRANRTGLMNVDRKASIEIDDSDVDEKSDGANVDQDDDEMDAGSSDEKGNWGNPFDASEESRLNETVFVPQVAIPEASTTSYTQDGLISTYLSGILWCLEMYRTGLCPNYKFVYPWPRAPMASEIAEFVQSKKSASGTKHRVRIPVNEQPALPAPVCAAMILQTECKQYMDPRYRPLIDIFASCPDDQTSIRVLLDAYQKIQLHYKSKQLDVVSEKSRRKLTDADMNAVFPTVPPFKLISGDEIPYVCGTPCPYSIRLMPRVLDPYWMNVNQIKFVPTVLLNRKSMSMTKPFLKVLLEGGQSGLSMPHAIVQQVSGNVNRDGGRNRASQSKRGHEQQQRRQMHQEASQHASMSCDEFNSMDDATMLRHATSHHRHAAEAHVKRNRDQSAESHAKRNRDHAHRGRGRNQRTGDPRIDFGL